ncbi:MAG: PilZ domain-containing protein, partial [Acidobacteria bacterium]|nr:PilZ domain-containing protein [Acidobacteriota bacterium]
LTPQPSTTGKRRNTRVNTRLLACIRQPGFADEVVMTENMSRGGLCFRSNKSYVSGSPIEVAVPFAAGGANIFVPARVAHVMHKESDNITRVGVAYLQGDGLLRHV